MRTHDAMAGGKDTDLEIGAVGGAKATQGITGASATDATPATQSAQASGGVDDITRALAAGEIDAAQAQQQLIESVLAEQLPIGASAELEASVRAEVESLLANDPTLQALLSPGA